MHALIFGSSRDETTVSAAIRPTTGVFRLAKLMPTLGSESELLKNCAKQQLFGLRKTKTLKACDWNVHFFWWIA